METAFGSYSDSTVYYEGDLFPSYIKIMPNPLSEVSSMLFDMKDVVINDAIAFLNADESRKTSAVVLSRTLSFTPHEHSHSLYRLIH